MGLPLSNRQKEVAIREAIISSVDLCKDSRELLNRRFGKCCLKSLLEKYSSVKLLGLPCPRLFQCLVSKIVPYLLFLKENTSTVLNLPPSTEIWRGTLTTVYY